MRQPAIPLTPNEKRAAIGLAAVFAARMLGLFLILPVFALHAPELAGATPLLIGLAIGAYGLTQALLQIPFGLMSDRFGRKPMIYIGLCLFTLGSVVAALAGDIWLVILGRVLQGAGAIAAVVMALAADLTREEVRTRAMAGIGASIGLAFGGALVLGPILAAAGGLFAVFWSNAALAVAAMAVLYFVVPSPLRSTVHRDSQPVIGQLGRVLRNPDLLRLDYGIFTLHLVMTALFLVVPKALKDAGVAAADHWLVYLPVLILSILAMVPFMIAAERAGRVKAVMLGAGAAVATAALLFAAAGSHLIALTAVLVLFFTAVNLLEAVLPATLSKVSPAGSRGTAMGAFSTAQFLGAFSGGLVGGTMHQFLGAEGVYLLGAAAGALWLAVATGMREPPHIENRLIRLGPLTPGEAGLHEQRLLEIPGVRAAVVVAEEGVAYLKVDPKALDDQALAACTA